MLTFLSSAFVSGVCCDPDGFCTDGIPYCFAIVGNVDADEFGDCCECMCIDIFIWFDSTCKRFGEWSSALI